MNLLKKTCGISGFAVLLAMLISPGFALAADAEFMKFEWSFPKQTAWKYSISQKAQIQNYLHLSDLENPGKSAIHEEFLTGSATLKSLEDGNVYGDIILQLVDIQEHGRSMTVSSHQKVPQKVCRFIMTSDGTMEQYSGPKKETYVLTRLIFGMPIQPLKQNEVRVYPFSVYTDKDEGSTPLSGRISHEFRTIVDYKNKKCAKVITTVDLTDYSPGKSVTRSNWKGSATGLFNIEDKRMEKIEWKLALKKDMVVVNQDDPTMIIEVFEITVELTETGKENIIK
ncbi:hypothetical protein K8T06_13775 [bacterium]|nr:hypothetical protein [bacterium]